MKEVGGSIGRGGHLPRPRQDSFPEVGVVAETGTAGNDQTQGATSVVEIGSGNEIGTIEIETDLEVTFGEVVRPSDYAGHRDHPEQCTGTDLGPENALTFCNKVPLEGIQIIVIGIIEAQFQPTIYEIEIVVVEGSGNVGPVLEKISGPMEFPNVVETGT